MKDLLGKFERFLTYVATLLIGITIGVVLVEVWL